MAARLEDLWRKSLKKGAGKAALVAAGGVFTDYIMMRLLLKLALERKCRLYKGHSNRRKLYEEEIQEGRTWIGQQEIEEINIYSKDGLKLSGHLLKAVKPRRILVLFHGWRSSWIRDFSTCARSLYERDCTLLFVEQRSQGQSEGAYMGMGVLEREDCYCWLDWVQSFNTKDLPVYLYGVSMGAATVLMAAGEKLPLAVKGIIADCGFSSPYDMVMQFGKKHFKLIGKSSMRRLNWLCKRKAGVDLKAYTAVTSMKQCKVPVLFIHGKEDTFVPYEMTLKNYNACNSEKELLLTEGADHCMSFLMHKEEYLEAVDRLFEKNIK